MWRGRAFQRDGRYQVPREETSINLTKISEQVYCDAKLWDIKTKTVVQGNAAFTLLWTEDATHFMHTILTKVDNPPPPPPNNNMSYP